MLHHHLHAIPTKMVCELLGQIHRAVLSAGAAEGNHQAFESAPLIVGHCGIHQRSHIGEKTMNTSLPLQILNDGSILSGELFETLFTSGIRQSSGVKDKSATVSGIVPWLALVK